MNNSFFALCIFLTGCLMTSCNDELSVGSGLVGDQPIEADFTDEIEISAITVPPVTRFVGYRNNGAFDKFPYLLGSLDDPNFGQTDASVFVTPRIDTTRFIPDFTISLIDSVVMTIPFDTLGTFGDTTATHLISVHRIAEDIDLASVDTLFADTCIDFEATSIIERSFVPRPRDSILFFNPSSDTIEAEIAQLRFPLDIDVWESALIDPITLLSTQSLVDQVKGYAITSETSNSSMIGLNLRAGNGAEIQVFYTDSAKGVYRLDLSTTSNSSLRRDETSIKHNCYTSDFSGSEVGRTLEDPTAEFNYLEGMEGFNVQYDLSAINDLDNDQFINFGVLEFYLLQDGTEPITQLQAVYIDSLNPNGPILNIEDTDVSIFSDDFFNGTIQEVEEDGMTLMKYEVIVTNHLINLKNGEITTPFLYLRPSFRDLARHSILHSPNHPDRPAKLNLITTKP